MNLANAISLVTVLETVAVCLERENERNAINIYVACERVFGPDDADTQNALCVLSRAPHSLIWC